MKIEKHIHKAKYSEEESPKLLDECAECGKSWRDTDVHFTEAEWRKKWAKP